MSRKNIIVVLVAAIFIFILLYFLVLKQIVPIYPYIGVIYSSAKAFFAYVIAYFSIVIAMVTIGVKSLKAILPNVQSFLKGSADDVKGASDLAGEGVKYLNARQKREEEKEGRLKKDVLREFKKEKLTDIPDLDYSNSRKIERDYVPLRFSNVNQRQDNAIQRMNGMLIFEPERLIHREQRILEYSEEDFEPKYRDDSQPEKTNNWYLIEGYPGSGKTFYLKRLQWQVLRHAPEFQKATYPFFVDLQEFTSSEIFQEIFQKNKSIPMKLDKITLKDQEELNVPLLFRFIISKWQKLLKKYSEDDMRNFLVNAMRNGEVVLLLDGLENAFREKKGGEKYQFTYNTVDEQIVYLAEEFPEVLIFVTLRSGTKYGDLHKDFRGHCDVGYRLHIKDFRLEDMRTFINNCSAFRENSERQSKLWEILERSIYLQSLSANPLMLAYLCDSYSKSSRYPSQYPYTICEQYFKLLLLQRANSGHNHNHSGSHEQLSDIGGQLLARPGELQQILSPDLLLNILKNLSWTMHKQGTYAWSYEDIIAEIEKILEIKKFNESDVRPKVIYKRIIDSVLIPQGLLKEYNNGLSFPNIVSQQYLVTKYAVEYSQDNPGVEETLRNEAENPWWEEVLVLYLSQRPVQEAITVINQLAKWESPDRSEQLSHEMSLLIAHYGAVLNKNIEGDSHNDIMNKIKDHLIGVLKESRFPFLRELAGVAFAQYTESGKLKSETWSPLLEPYLDRLPKVYDNEKRVIISNDQEIKDILDKIFRELFFFDEDKIIKLLCDVTHLGEKIVEFDVLTRLHMISAWCVRELQDRNVVTKYSKCFMSILKGPTNGEINLYVLAGIVRAVGLLGDKESFSDLLDMVNDPHRSEFLRWNILTALTILNNRWGYCESNTLLQTLKNLVNGGLENDILAVQGVNLLISEMFHYPDQFGPPQSMSFPYSYPGLFVHETFASICMHELCITAEIENYSYSKAVDNLLEELIKKHIKLGHYEWYYLLDIIGQLSSNTSIPSVLESFDKLYKRQLNVNDAEEMPVELLEKRKHVDWILIRRQKAEEQALKRGFDFH